MVVEQAEARRIPTVFAVAKVIVAKGLGNGGKISGKPLDTKELADSLQCCSRNS